MAFSHKRSRLLVLFATAALAIAVAAPPAAVEPAAGATDADKTANFKSDNKPDPMTTRQNELKQMAFEAKLAGKAPGKVKEVAKGQYVDLAREGTGHLWTVLGEFADMDHNTMREPNRDVDNSTIWTPDFSREHYLDLLLSVASADTLDRPYRPVCRWPRLRAVNMTANRTRSAEFAAPQMEEESQ